MLKLFMQLLIIILDHFGQICVAHLILTISTTRETMHRQVTTLRGVCVLTWHAILKSVTHNVNVSDTNND